MLNKFRKTFKNHKNLAAMLTILQLITFSSVWASSQANNIKAKDNFVEINNTKLHYVENGKGQAIVLLHGNEGTLQDFTCSIFDQLASKYQTIAFDRPGHGQSEAPAKVTPTPEVQAALLHDALIKLNIQRPVLVAHSWSGSVALSYALQFPNDVSALVLIGAMAYDNGIKPKLCYHAIQVPVIGSFVACFYKKFGRRAVETQLQAAFSPDNTPKQYEEHFLSTMFKTSELKAAAEDEITINSSLRRISPSYSQIKIPVIIVAGAFDKTVSPQQNSYALHNAIKQSLLIIIADSGHELLFTRPDNVLKAIDLAVNNSSLAVGLSALPQKHITQ